MRPVVEPCMATTYEMGLSYFSDLSKGVVGVSCNFSWFLNA